MALEPVHHVINPVREIWFWIILALFAGSVLAVGLGYSHPSDTTFWIILMALILAFVGYLGYCTMGTWEGIIINERNLMSLSRMQITAWTILIVSALMVMVAVRVAANVPDALNIEINQEIWAVLGLSAFAAVGTPMINNAKSIKEPAPDTKDPSNTPVTRAATLLNENAADIEEHRHGVLYANNTPDEARFTDIFEGDELANTMYIDITKVQMFWLSLIALAGYAFLLLNLFLTATPDTLTKFPAFSDGYLAILAVSHATYLGGKTITQTKSTGS